MATAITWSVCCGIANMAICFLGYWRCFANNYLHWAAVCTWVLFNIQGECGSGWVVNHASPAWSIKLANPFSGPVVNRSLNFSLSPSLSGGTGFVGQGVGFADREYLVWYILFVIFVPYAMLPLPLKWCVVGGTITASCHLAVITIIKLQHGEVLQLACHRNDF